jgi:hypothetical protein
MRARTRIAHLQSERPTQWFLGHRWRYENTSDRCSTLSHVNVIVVGVGVVVIDVGILVVVVSVGVSAGVVVVRTTSQSPPPIRAACGRPLKTPWEL